MKRGEPHVFIAFCRSLQAVRTCCAKSSQESVAGLEGWACPVIVAFGACSDLSTVGADMQISKISGPIE